MLAQSEQRQQRALEKVPPMPSYAVYQSTGLQVYRNSVMTPHGMGNGGRILQYTVHGVYSPTVHSPQSTAFHTVLFCYVWTEKSSFHLLN